MLHILYTTLPDIDTANHIARALVEHKLVACAQVMPAHQSFYYWEGALCNEPEVALWCKTPAAMVEKAMAHLQGLHPYDTPCLLAWPASHANPAYAAWAQHNTAICGE